MANVGDFVGDMVGTAVGGVGNVVGGVGNVVGDVATSVGNIATDLGGGIAGLAQDTGSLAQDVYNNTVNDPGAMMGIANVAGRVAGIPGLTAVAGPASIALGYMGQGERDKTLGINNPTALGRLARSLVPSIVQRPVFDFLGVTGGPDSFGGYGTEEAEQEGVAGIDTSGTNPDAAIGGGETRHDADEPDSYDEVEDIEDYEDYDEDQYAQGGAVGFARGGLQNKGGLATLYEKIGSLGDFETKERIIGNVLSNSKGEAQGSQLNYQGELTSDDKNYQGLLDLGVLAQEEASATYKLQNTFKLATVPNFMKKIVIDPKLSVGVAGQLSLTDINQPSSRVYTAGIGAQFFPGVSDTGVNLSAVSNQRGTTPTVRVDQSMGPFKAQYQKTFNPDQPDFSKFDASFNVPINEANLAANFSRNPNSDSINLNLSGIDFLGGKAALSAEKTFNSTGEDPRKVGATWKKQVGEGEIEVQGSINNRENYVGATFNMPLN